MTLEFLKISISSILNHLVQKMTPTQQGAALLSIFSTNSTLPFGDYPITYTQT